MPKSYPASCDFMVAKPPTYQESMNNSKYRVNNYNNNFQHNVENMKNIKPAKNKKTLCNIQ